MQSRVMAMMRHPCAGTSWCPVGLGLQSPTACTHACMHEARKPPLQASLHVRACNMHVSACMRPRS
jgi:hypothetical protein